MEFSRSVIWRVWASVLRQTDTAIALVLVPAGTVTALYVRGVSYRDLHLMQMSGDGLLSYLFATHFEQSSSLTLNEIAFPNGLSIFAWPGTDHFLLALTFLLTRLSGSGIVAVNAIFFLGFGLALASSYWVLARLIGSRALAFVLAVSYAFLPEHWKRQSHIALSLYWILPFMVYTAVRLAERSLNVIDRTARSTLPQMKEHQLRRRTVTFALTSVFLVVHGTYFAFYFVLLLIMVTLFVHLSLRTIRLSSHIDLFIAVYFCVLGFVVVLSTVLARAAGTDLRIFGRRPLESVLYGGQLRTLAMPWGGSELPFAAKFTSEITSLLAANENEFWQSTIGALAFWLAITLVLVAIVRRDVLERVDRNIGVLTFAFFGLLLFFFSGGLGYFFSFLQPQFRAWNRLSLLITFVSLLLLGLVIARFLDGMRGLSERGNAQFKLLLLILTLVVLQKDLLPSNLRLDLSGFRAGTKEISEFAGLMEKELSDGCAVYQLPEAQFPEVPPLETLNVYELFYPALYTSHLRYSYGQMKQNEWWLSSPPSRAKSDSDLRELRQEGYCAIYVDALGYSDEGLMALEGFFGRLQLERFESTSGRWSLYKLR